MSDASKLELHFYFADDSHTMDAIVRNENEKELLAILKAVISTFGFPVTIDSEAFQQGGFKQTWTLVGESAPQITTVLALTSLFISAKPKKDSAAEIASKIDVKAEKVVEVQRKKHTLDKAKKELRESEKLYPDTIKEIITVLEANPRLVWHRSNFYKKINIYLKIERLSATLLNGNRGMVGAEKIVVRRNFPAFIVNSNELPPNIDEEAVVEIVVPVLTTAKSKWKGVYKGSSITFDVKDEEFRKSVFSQQIEFKNGVAIKCVLQLVQRIDGRGVIKTKSITVLNVVGIINPPDSTTTNPLAPANITAGATLKTTAAATIVVQEPAPIIAQKKTPKVDDRQLDMFG